MAQGFHKAECNICKRETWHYKEGDQIARCSCHSAYPNRVMRQQYENSKNSTIQGGSLYSRLGSELPTEREIKIANRLDRSLWSFAEERRNSRVVLDSPWAQDIFADSEPVKPLNPDKLNCTFCGVETDKINSLTEKKAVICKVMDTYKTADGEVQIREKISSRVETVHACPNCCLQVRKPIVVRRV
jgi:hypothetical protein